MHTTTDTDEMIRKVSNVLAATQEIPRPQKDLLRKQIRAWYRTNVGDRLFFADSDLHRKHERRTNYGMGLKLHRRLANG